MNDPTFFYLIGAINGALAGLAIANYYRLQWQQAETRAANWERQARQLAQRFEPLPPMRLIECAGHPVLWPNGCAEPEAEVEWPDDLEAGR